MEPLDDLDPLDSVFPEDDGYPLGVSVLLPPSAASATAPARQPPTVAFPLDPLLAPVFRAFDRAGVTWCLLRMPQRPVAGDGHEDVVALVDRGAIATARAVLMAHSFAPLPPWGSSRRFVGYDPQTDVWVTLEVVAELAYGSPELESRPERGCLERRRWDGGIHVLAADDEFWTLLLGILLDGEGRDGRVLARLERLTIEARTDSPLARLAGSLLPPRWTPMHLVDCVWEADWGPLDLLMPSMQEAWARQRAHAARQGRLLTALRAASVRHLLTSRRGFSVALLGPDGAAKAALARELGRTFILPVTFMRMAAPPRRRRDGRLARAGFFRTLLTQAQRYAAGRARKAKGRLVIFDRYTYDWRLAPVKRVPALGKLRRFLLGRSVPAPDLVVVLDAPLPARLRMGVPAVELGSRAAAAEALRGRYLALSQSLPDAIVVDAAGGADQLRREVTARIWRAYATAPPPAWLRPLRAASALLPRS
ncbi:MAG: hypothetical protein NVSMB32_02120 [Actinomycetota bacterium]